MIKKSILIAILFMHLALIPALAAPPAQDGQILHVVQPGETLFAIAQRYGTTIDAIIAANQLDNPDSLVIGQKLVIPVAAAVAPPIDLMYTVRPGDTLTMIARRYSTTVDELARLNLLLNPNLIYVGQQLYLPDTTSVESSDSSGFHIYVAQPGDTLAKIAARHGLTVWALAQFNGIANPNIIQVGQRLLIPGDGPASNLPTPLVSITILPAIAIQGQTLQIVVETNGPVSIDGAYNGLPLFWSGEVSPYRTLIGIPAMARPGTYALEIRVLQGDLNVSAHSMIQVVEGVFGTQYLSFDAETSKLLDADLVEQEAQLVWDTTIQATLPQHWSGPLNLPLDGQPKISAPFGIRRAYGNVPPTSFHSGVDYAVPAGTPIYAPAPGKVVLAEALQVRGGAVIVDHGRGVMSGYWHLSQIDVVVGQMVNTGDLLGLVGSTGLSTGAHLHWELRVMGVPVDPLQWTYQTIQ